VSAPWLSVIVPTFNGAQYLPAALESIVTQGDANIEVIAVDDGSTDATLTILESFANRLPLTVVRRRVGNWVANTNLGLEKANGEWACFLHQDDLWRPGRLAVVSAALGVCPSPSASEETNSSLALGLGQKLPALLLTAAEFITATGRPVGSWRCPLAPGTRGNTPEFVASRLLVQNFVPLPTAVFRRADALAVGGLDPDLWYTADWDLWLKLAALGPTRYLPKPLAVFRLHPESQTVKRSGGMADFRRQHEIIWERHWPRWRRKCPNPERVEAAARLSVEINVLLAGLLHRGGGDWRRLASAAVGAGPVGWAHCLNSSRLPERVLARLRAGLGRA
jgi:glycosyltransferase involved in cell wall biosynthesis